MDRTDCLNTMKCRVVIIAMVNVSLSFVVVSSAHEMYSAPDIDTRDILLLFGALIDALVVSDESPVASISSWFYLCKNLCHC